LSSPGGLLDGEPGVPSHMHEDRPPDPELHARWRRCFDRLTDLRELALSLNTQATRSPADIELLKRLESAIHEEGRLGAILLVAANLPAETSK
jgi:hypothetical protein